MKRFQCGDVVPGCKKTFQFQEEDQILSAVAEHARDDHHLVEIPAALVMQVRSYIHDVPAA